MTAFQIKNDLKQVCMEVVTDDPAGPINGARAYRRCPSDLNPQRCCVRFSKEKSLFEPVLL